MTDEMKRYRVTFAHLEGSSEFIVTVHASSAARAIEQAIKSALFFIQSATDYDITVQ